MTETQKTDVQVRIAGAHVAELIWSRPPNNYIDAALVREIADTLEQLDATPACRVVVLAPEGKHFCAGSNLAARDRARDDGAVSDLYGEARRLFRTAKPLVAAVNGGAIGGGLGLALAADFRIVADDARLSANFSRLGYFPGFGMTATLPRLIGQQRAAQMFYTGRRVGAEEAVALGLAERMAPRAELRAAALAFAEEIAGSGPLSVMAIRARLRSGLAEAVDEAIALESAQQARLRQTRDFVEGVAAVAERRTPVFGGN
ncbi:MAG TPA: enoyl-CoA hydratase/isomerase family protein [Burkholderiales bacterium]|jgi:enoyl-CoA hydratase/carnithine racemase|nr:enoyl-CoA hydratase/isomerase family protein [Burkholderiales bacterium]